MDKTLYERVKEYKGTDAYNIFRKLLLATVQDLRIKNDSAEYETFLENRGAIRELKRILKKTAWHEKDPDAMQEKIQLY
jgi:hypothetical protein